MRRRKLKRIKAIRKESFSSFLSVRFSLDSSTRRAKPQKKKKKRKGRRGKTDIRRMVEEEEKQRMSKNESKSLSVCVCVCFALLTFFIFSILSACFSVFGDFPSDI